MCCLAEHCIGTPCKASLALKKTLFQLFPMCSRSKHFQCHFGKLGVDFPACDCISRLKLLQGLVHFPDMTFATFFTVLACRVLSCTSYKCHCWRQFFGGLDKSCYALSKFSKNCRFECFSHINKGIWSRLRDILTPKTTSLVLFAKRFVNLSSWSNREVLNILFFYGVVISYSSIDCTFAVINSQVSYFILSKKNNTLIATMCIRENSYISWRTHLKGLHGIG